MARILPYFVSAAEAKPKSFCRVLLLFPCPPFYGSGPIIAWAIALLPGGDMPAFQVQPVQGAL
jgi:hypothetical protein